MSLKRWGWKKSLKMWVWRNEDGGGWVWKDEDGEELGVKRIEEEKFKEIKIEEFKGIRIKVCKGIRMGDEYEKMRVEEGEYKEMSEENELEGRRCLRRLEKLWGFISMKLKRLCRIGLNLSSGKK